MKNISLSRILQSKYTKILIAMAKAIAASFVPYLFLAYTIAAGTDELYSKAVTDFLACFIVAVLFCCFFHIFYTTKQNKEYALSLNTKEPFSAKKEAFRFFCEEGIPFLKVYGVLAVFEWLFSTLYFFWRIRTPISVALWFVFPFQSPYNITPGQYVSNLASPFTSIVFLLPSILLLAVRSRKKLYEKYR